MLAGYSSTLRIIADASLSSFQHEMSTQRFDLPCGLPRKDNPRIAISLDNKGVDSARGGFSSFRQKPRAAPTSSSSSSLVARSLPRESVREVEIDNFWDRKKHQPPRNLKRTHDGGDNGIPSKRVRGDGIPTESQQQEQRGGSLMLPTNSASSSGNNTHCTSETNTSHQLPPYETTFSTGGDDGGRSEQHCLELLDLLMACVENLSSRNLVATNYFLSKLGELASPEGSPVHRLVAYYTEALAIRVARLWPNAFCVAPPRELVEEDYLDVALRVLNHVTPVPRFIHFTMNEIILRAFEGKDRVHIIDFDIKQGLQWPGLFQSLASRPNPPTHVRITGIGDSKQELQDTGIRLAGLADELGLAFEFHAVVDRFEDVRFWMLHVKEGECVAVSCPLQLHRALYDDGHGVLSDFLGLVRSTNPTVIVVAEQEAAHNDPRWEARVATSLPYYAAVFDAVGAALPTGSPARMCVEQMFAREIRNVVACEGSERTERHEAFGTWRRAMEERGGFRSFGVTEREVMQSRMLLRMFSQGDKYSLTMQGAGAGITLRWMEQPLYTVSAWAPAGLVAGSSTASISQREQQG